MAKNARNFINRYFQNRIEKAFAIEFTGFITLILVACTLSATMGI